MSRFRGHYIIIIKRELLHMTTINRTKTTRLLPTRPSSEVYDFRPNNKRTRRAASSGNRILCNLIMSQSDCRDGAAVVR